ncbi:MAG: hypothetical protein Ct9H90mP10_10790 [Actinomycetota bacterium]|nr:MAG: hypothetical protein Ct9H90mP10_10790 [Actinomycetota bacterium]
MYEKSNHLLLLLSFCSSGSDSTSDEPTQSAAASSIEELVYEDANGNLVNEDLLIRKPLLFSGLIIEEFVGGVASLRS